MQKKKKDGDKKRITTAKSHVMIQQNKFKSRQFLSENMQFYSFSQIEIWNDTLHNAHLSGEKRRPTLSVTDKAKL